MKILRQINTTTTHYLECPICGHAEGTYDTYDTYYHYVLTDNEEEEVTIVWDCGNLKDEFYDFDGETIELNEEELDGFIKSEECPVCNHRLGKNRIIHHGLSAFTGQSTLNDVEDRLVCIITDKESEMCGCSIRHCGPIGITGSAFVTHSFEHDCWSTKNTDGSREFGRMNPYSDHDECWFKNMKPTLLWVKDWFWSKINKEEREFIVSLADDYNIRLSIIKKEVEHE